jgi:flagellar biosynthesis protein FlhB
MQRLIDFIQNPIKSFLATVFGAVTGTVPEITTSINNGVMTDFDRIFQHAVWTVTIILGVLGIVAAVQKQIDRYKHRKNTDNEDNYEELI